MTTPYAQKIQKSIIDSAVFQEHIEQARELIEARPQPRPSLLRRLFRSRPRSNWAVDTLRESAVAYIIIERKVEKLDNQFQLKLSGSTPTALDHYMEKEKESMKNQEDRIKEVLGLKFEELEREVKEMEGLRSRLIESLRRAQKKVRDQGKAENATSHP
ncbi:hypothetical protein CAEBREN_12012 [Caenorhabditis brenneri]|uniref:Uncharacterized protein n=1 Tax=Caenorhabditis brenneri TaxID=135651 RepID=G0NQJ4_CAEBE|nr:hypothetical protein CAEBREN_12012 [Caenorhabditis brenneri]